MFFCYPTRLSLTLNLSASDFDPLRYICSASILVGIFDPLILIIMGICFA